MTTICRARALAGRLREPLDGLERGFLLETWILHELRAAMARLNTGGRIRYWRTPSCPFLPTWRWTSSGPARHAVGFKVKAATRWKKEYGLALKILIADGALDAGYGIYAGTDEFQDWPLRILPLKRFFADLTAGRLLR